MSLNATNSKQTKAKLTKAMIADLEPASKDYFLWDTQMSGFGLKVTPQNRKTYVAQFRIAGVGNAKRMTIGVLGQIGLASKWNLMLLKRYLNTAYPWLSELLEQAR